MYRFHSLGETSINADGHGYTVMAGIKPPKQEEDLADFNPEEQIFDFFIMNRHPKQGMYIDGATLEQVTAFLHFAKHNPQAIAQLHQTHKGSGLTTEAVTLDEITDDDGSMLARQTSDFDLLPSFEPFVLPTYVDSQTQYINKQIVGRLQPYLALRKALQLNNDDQVRIMDAWSKRNGAMNRLSHPICGNFDPKYFDPIYWCPDGNHAWEWLQVGGEDKKLFVRTAFIVNSESDNSSVLSKEEGPGEYLKAIPDLVCPWYYNRNEKSEDGYLTFQIPVTKNYGIHARPGIEITKYAARWPGKVRLELNGNKRDAKEVMDLLQLNACKGSILKVCFEDVGSPHLLDEIYLGIYHAATTELDKLT